MIQTENILTSTLVLSSESGEYKATAEVIKAFVQTTIVGSQNQHGHIANGNVYKDEQKVATFSKYNNISIAYLTADETEQAEILSAVQSFCTEARQYIDEASINVTTEEDTNNG